MRTRALALSGLLIVLSSHPLIADEVPPNPMVEVSYQKPKTAAFDPIYARLKERKVLERLSSFLYPLKLPTPLKVSTAECGGIFKPFNRRDGVVICYEVIQNLRSSARKASRGDEVAYRIALVGAATQATLYRTASGLIDVLDIPVWGRHADAADKLASIIMLRFGGSAVATITMEGMTAYFLGSEKVWSGTDFAETRAPTVQRYYNYACLAFGSDPATFVSLKENVRFLFRARFISSSGTINDGVTDESNYCTFEFLKASRDFAAVMGPHIDAAKLEKLKEFKIFYADDFQENN